MVKAIPAPSLRELSSEARLRECTPMNVTAQKFQSQYALVCKSLAWSNHRTTLPQSRPSGVPAPSEREPGWGAYHSSYHSETARLRAIFIAPTKLRGGYIPPFIVPLRNRNVAGDFHRPYETQRWVHSTIQRTAQKPQDCGRFSSPLRKLKNHLPVSTRKRYRVGQGTNV